MLEYLRNEWRRVQREVQQARDAPRGPGAPRAGAVPARQGGTPHQRAVYRRRQAAFFPDHEGEDAEPVRARDVAAETGGGARPPPARRLASPAALRRAVVLREILGPAKALQPPESW